MNDLENRGDEIKKKNAFCIKKEKTIGSLFEVEHFLGDFKKIINGIKFYKILKY